MAIAPVSKVVVSASLRRVAAVNSGKQAQAASRGDRMNDEPILVDEPAHQGLGKARPAMREQILAGFLLQVGRPLERDRRRRSAFSPQDASFRLREKTILAIWFIGGA